MRAGAGKHPLAYWPLELWNAKTGCFVLLCFALFCIGYLNSLVAKQWNTPELKVLLGNKDWPSQIKRSFQEQPSWEDSCLRVENLLRCRRKFKDVFCSGKNPKTKKQKKPVSGWVESIQKCSQVQYSVSSFKSSSAKPLASYSQIYWVGMGMDKNVYCRVPENHQFTKGPFLRREHGWEDLMSIEEFQLSTGGRVSSKQMKK